MGIAIEVRTIIAEQMMIWNGGEMSREKMKAGS